MPIEIAIGKASHWLASKAGEAVVEHFKEKIKQKVLGRWGEHRAQKFTERLVEEVRKEQEIKGLSADLNDVLEKLLEGESQSALLYDSYRRVALCASRDVGPKVIGLLTAGLLLKDQQATTEDEQLFLASESLHDRDFVDFMKWFSVASESKRNPRPPLPIIPMIQSATAVARVRSSLTRGVFSNGDTPINLFYDVGPFAPKLERVGLLMEFSHPKGANTNEVEHFVTANVVALRLYFLAQRALEATH
ncbi:hypothetical protein [Burkholderia gladioli]|uniref:hypothetical protein n=1 Tax=Burkholderia gladioli TaxID=28095 RepID=UPI0016403AA4|nr:hypothetical protein [Burkholderia gladioli]